MKIRRLVLLVLALVGLVAAPAHAASFNCEKAAAPMEKAICADAPLSKRDEELAAAYDAVRRQLSASGAAAVQADQREWLKWLRARCAGQATEATPCLNEEYRVRLDQLQQGVLQLGGALFFTRLKVFFLPGKSPPHPDRAIQDPGLGHGRLSWPEIDHPTPQQAQWNAVVRGLVADVHADADSELDANYAVEAANGALISLSLVHSRNYGAAYPMVDYRSLNWLPAKHRVLQAQDFLRPDSGWESFMAQRCEQEADRQMREASVHNPFPDPVAGAINVVADPAHWTFGPKELTISFPDYVLTPRAFPLSVTFSWTELKPFWADGFDPASLPEPRTHP